MIAAYCQAHLHTDAGHNLDGDVVSDGSNLLEEDDSKIPFGSCSIECQGEHGEKRLQVFAVMPPEMIQRMDFGLSQVFREVLDDISTCIVPKNMSAAGEVGLCSAPIVP